MGTPKKAFDGWFVMARSPPNETRVSTATSRSVVATCPRSPSDAPTGWETDPQYVYIGRAGKGHDGFFGNPYQLRPGQDRGATIEKFRSYCAERIAESHHYRRSVKALKGKTLVCFCKPEACHGDVLAQEAESTEV